MEDKVTEQENADATADPVFTSEEVPGQTKRIESIVQRLMKKPKPKPKVSEGDPSLSCNIIIHSYIQIVTQCITHTFRNLRRTRRNPHPKRNLVSPQQSLMAKRRRRERISRKKLLQVKTRRKSQTKLLQKKMTNLKRRMATNCR